VAKGHEQLAGIDCHRFFASAGIRKELVRYRNTIAVCGNIYVLISRDIEVDESIGDTQASTRNIGDFVLSDTPAIEVGLEVTTDTDNVDEFNKNSELIDDDSCSNECGSRHDGASTAVRTPQSNFRTKQRF
jgi:hypothetical protein